MKWTQRACIIYFYLHPFMGGKSIHFTAKVFAINYRTLGGWLSKLEMILRWLPIVKSLEGRSVRDAIPPKFIEKYQAPDARYDSKYLNLTTYEKKLKKLDNDMKQTKFSVVRSGSSSRLDIVRAKKEKTLTIRRQAKRVRTSRGPLLYLDVRAAIENEVKQRWLNGIPITRPEIYRFLKRTFVSGEFYEKFLAKIEYADKLCNFVTRTLEYFGYCVRKTTVSQSIPKNWKDLAIEGAARVRKTFEDENVSVVIAADETFLRFHESSSTVLVPKGAKRVGTAIKCNEKEGCTVMVSMEMISSQLLPPFVIFKGKFGMTLMKKWQKYSESTVLFTQNHWMTAETNILYFKYLKGLFPGRKIGLIYDNAPSHVSSEVRTWIEEHNETVSENEKIVVEFVDPCLTSVYQPPDVVMNAPLKRLIRQQYHDYVNQLLRDPPSGVALKAGDKFVVSREALLIIGFVENAYQNINAENVKKRWIAESFDRCGLNPWNGDQQFRKHLGKLSESGVCAALSAAHEAEILDKTVKAKRAL